MVPPSGPLQDWSSRLLPTTHRRAPLPTGVGGKGNGHQRQPPKQYFLSDLVLINRTLYSSSLPLIHALQLLLLLDLWIIKKHYVSEIPIEPRWLTRKGRAPNSCSSQGRWGPTGRRAASQGPGCSAVLGSCSEAQCDQELQAGVSASQGDN